MKDSAAAPGVRAILDSDAAKGRSAMGLHRGSVRTVTGTARPGLRLLALPHSGGRAESFTAWRAPLPAAFPETAVELCAAQYPGHGDRLAEPPMEEVGAIAEEIVADLARLPPADLLLFGHSFGSAVACEVARRCPGAGIDVVLLVASSAWAPGDPARSPRDEHLLPDEELWERLVALGGVDPGIAAETEIRDLVLPAIRADIGAHERYLGCPDPVSLSCDVHACMARGDPLVPVLAGHYWSRLTTGNATVDIRPGAHFHLFDDPAPLLADLARRVPTHARKGRTAHE
ncbi:thioesterase [Streptomyces sp. OF3]|uniref:Thioesterase n=1 Tax=Streptomyces alkaliterrae TaxID=2213162 RepID=A0A7W3ZL94_9ACTN|nr:thioesterase [Streptomyces alkaliterrae]